MEIICFIIGAIVVISLISNAGKSSSESSTAAGGSSYPPPSQPRMGSFEIRATEDRNWRGKDLHVIKFEARGLMPVYRTMQIDFVTWMEDLTDDANGDPVFCSLDNFRHHESPVFQSVRGGGPLSPDEGFLNWVEIGIAPTDALSFPKGGNRRLKIYGYVTEKTSPSLRKSLLGATCSLYFLNSGVGYKEWEGKRLEMLKLSLRLGVATAFADNNFGDKEGKVIKAWLKKRIDRLDDDEQENAKQELNAALMQAFEDARRGTLQIDSEAETLAKSPIKQASYDALELCTIVMAADGIIQPEEVRIVDRIGRLLGIDNDGIRSLRDKHAQQARPQAEEGNVLSDEMLLGLDANLTPDQMKKKLRELFARYNAMMQIEKDATKRARSQTMLDAIARLSSKLR